MNVGDKITVVTLGRLHVFVLVDKRIRWDGTPAWRASAVIPAHPHRPDIFYALPDAEGTRWIEGVHDEGSMERLALLAASALVPVVESRGAIGATGRTGPIGPGGATGPAGVTGPIGATGWRK
jgi:hypothetical protein